MYNEHLEHLRDFFDKYGMHDIITESKTRAKTPFTMVQGFNGITAEDMYWSNIPYETFKEYIINLRLPLDSLKKIAEIVNEWDQLYKNPESAQLLHEAIFINRIKQGI